MTPALTAGLLLAAATALWYLYRGYVVRSHFQRLQRQGVVRLVLSCPQERRFVASAVC